MKYPNHKQEPTGTDEPAVCGAVLRILNQANPQLLRAIVRSLVTDEYVFTQQRAACQFLAMVEVHFQLPKKNAGVGFPVPAFLFEDCNGFRTVSDSATA